MQTCELVTTVTAIACAISNSCSEEEVEILAAVFTQLGDTLATINTSRGIKNKGKEDNEKGNNELCKNDTDYKDIVKKDVEE